MSNKLKINLKEITEIAEQRSNIIHIKERLFVM